jgi:hypothetical protein
VQVQVAHEPYIDERQSVAKCERRS